MVEVGGIIVSGRGNARGIVKDNREELRDKLGTALFEGSLNVLLDRPLLLRASTAVKVAGGRRLIWRALLNGHSVWAYRWPDAPLHVVEILSEVQLRQALGLNERERVTVSVSREDTLPVSPAASLVWALWWRGRLDWYYTGDRYKEYAKKGCRYFAATQSRAMKES
jgi:hypothetical protein